MEEKKILVCDNKKIFSKMFKRKFSTEFEFIDSAFLNNNYNKIKKFEHMIFVIYNKFELIDFLKLYKQGTNILICVFNKQLYSGLSFFENYNGFVLLDGSKSRKEIISELQSSFKNAFHFAQQQNDSLPVSSILSEQAHHC